MTLFRIFSVFDSKVCVYLRPVFAQSKGQVIRELSDVVNDPAKQAAFSKHPGDYSLFEIGTFDDATASLVPHIAPERILVLHELVRE